MYLGLDASTQSISAILIDTETQQIQCDESVNFGQELPQYNAPSGFIPGGKNGEVHADPLMWVEALELLLQKMQSAGVDFSKVKAISGAGQQHATVYLSDNFEQTLSNLNPNKTLKEQIQSCLSRATAPIWMDSSSAEECQEIAEQAGGDETVCSRSGSLTTPRFSGPQIRKFFKQDPQGYASTQFIHLNSSFFASLFAGSSAFIDTGDGAGMNLMNLKSMDWDSTLLDATAPELASKLSGIREAGTFISSISPYFVEKYGFAADCKALTWTGDNPASLVGMGASKPGQMVISLGTSDTLFAAMPDAKTDPKGYGHVFGNPMGGFMSLICFANGSLAREKVKDDNDLEWSDFETEALSATSEGNSGKVAAPFFTPEITPRLQSNQVHTNGWDFDTADTASKVRAVLEGQFLNMKIHSSWMGVTPENILLTGGASKNSGIAQCIANIFQAKVSRLEVSSSVGLGSAIRAAVSCGEEEANLVSSFCSNLTKPITPTCDAASYAIAEQNLTRLLNDLTKQ